jgi:hypothetical protein
VNQPAHLRLRFPRRGSRPQLFLKLTVLLVPLFFTALLPEVNSQVSPSLTNGVVNPSFDLPNQVWDSNTQYGTISISDTTHPRTGSLSAKLAAPANTGPSYCAVSSCGDIVAAFVGQPFRSSLDYDLINLPISTVSLSAWWYVEPTQRPYSLRVLILFSDGSTPVYNLGYFYGASSALASNKTRSVYYNLGPITGGSPFETSRNVNADLQPFGITDPSSFKIVRIGFGALGNYTNGETAWVDDVGLMFDRPNAAFTVTPLPSRQLAFDASSSQPSAGAAVTSYAWDFGDNSTFSSAQPRADHTYSSLGMQNVTLRVVDSRGHLSSTSQFGSVYDSAPSNLLGIYGPGFLLVLLVPLGLYVRRRRRRRK